ncbi:MAG TPA: S26 family signal peptidase [Candidatus Saccharimonadales bacterium]|nr:S26 family signal peptidase [Candidatus Saccharimonadales bacterium]
MHVFKLAWLWLQIVGGVGAGLAALWLFTQAVFQVHFLAVQTGSMRPTFRPGDALIMQRTSIDQLQTGMIVSYHSSRNSKELVTHRLVKLSATSFQTEGDTLASPDPPVRASLLAGRVVAVLPGLGRALNWLRSLPGLVICVYLPALAIAVSELMRFEYAESSNHPYYLSET